VRYAFAGTPEFAAWVLAHLIAIGRRPAVVISQPNRPCGRGQKTAAPPVVINGGRLGFDCLQEPDINHPEAIARLKAVGVEALVVAGFGQMLRSELLESLLCLNVHASLLPAYRGAAPIERALAAGESRVGVSIMKITADLDGGPWASQSSVSVGLRDDSGSIGRVLAVLGACGVDQVLTGLADGTVSWNEQQGVPTYAAKLSAADQILDPSQTAKVVHDQVRSLSPGIGARVVVAGMGVKIWRTWPYDLPGLDPAPEPAGSVSGDAGRLRIRGERLFVGCGAGLVEVLSLQPAGKKTMPAAAFVRGYGKRLGERLEPSATGRE
jgi:methionyl-tRNA formyltransferase